MLRTTLPFTASVTASVVSFETTRSWASPIGVGEHPTSSRNPKSAAFALVRDGDVEEDALVFHPGDRIDDRPRVDRVEARCRRCPYVEGERGHTARYDGRLGLGGDALRARAVPVERDPLRLGRVSGSAALTT